MSLALINEKCLVCSQCGDILQNNLQAKFCKRCGSPVAANFFDPIKQIRSSTPVDARAKLIVRSGILGIGIVSILSGILLFYAGWLCSTEVEMDIIQLWISRLAAPMLVAQGIFYTWSPFRRPPAAKVIAFRRRLD